MATPRNQKYLIISIIFHAGILLMLVVGVDFSSPLPVIENTNKNDVISAVVLGDSPDSKILPQQPDSTDPKPLQEVRKEQKPVQQTEVKKDVIADIIAIRAAEKKLAEQRVLEAKKQRDLFAKDLLADIKKVKDKKKTIKQKQLKSHFEKTLREQAEKSLRQQLLDEEIKLKGSQNRQAQGVVNKYKALILQAISEHWIIPTQANKSLYCELMIRVAPGGMVLNAQITKSSGDPSLDSSARAAVLKASPLPVPLDAAAFEAFRQFVLKVKPENVIANDG